MDAAEFKTWGTSNNTPFDIDFFLPLIKSSSNQTCEGTSAAMIMNRISSLEIAASKYTPNSLLVSESFKILRSTIFNAKLKLNFIVIRGNENYGEYNMTFSSTDPYRGFKTDYYNYHYFNLHTNVFSRATLPTEQNLKYAVLKNIKLQESTLVSLSDMLPYIEVLKLIYCQNELDASHNITLDLLGIHHVRQLFLGIGFLIRHNFRHIVVQVEEISKDCVSYFKCKNVAGLKDMKGLRFLTTNADFINADGRFSSKRTRVIIIRCQKIDAINICFEKYIAVATIHP